jgi:hypothetical protein
MSDFPKGGDPDTTRAWLDKEGFENILVGWEADAILGKSDGFIKSRFLNTPEDQERAEMLCGLLNTARSSSTGKKVILRNIYPLPVKVLKSHSILSTAFVSGGGLQR